MAKRLQSDNEYEYNANDTIALIQTFKKNPENELVLLKLVKKYERLIYKLARRYSKRQDIYEDLVQVGMIGLLSAIYRFDPQFSKKFESYAIPTISGEMKRYIRDKTWSLRVPRKYKDLSFKIKNVVEELTVELQRSPKMNEIAEKLNVSEEDILHTMEASNNYKTLSYDKGIEPSSGVGKKVTLLEKLPADETLGIYELQDQRIIIEKLLQKLEERERKIIYYIYFEQLNQAEVGKKIGVSQMHVSRLHRAAMKKLEKYMEEIKLSY